MIDANFDKSNEEKLLTSKDSIRHIYVQILKMLELVQRSDVPERTLVHHCHDLKQTSSSIIGEFNQQKALILQRFDSWIMPIAKDVLDTLIQEAEELKSQLHTKLDRINEMTVEDWQNEAHSWEQLYLMWHDNRVLIDKILEIIADRTKYLIDRDIQVIKDYQTHSLVHISEGSETFKNMETRLNQAIEEPLRQLEALRNQPKDYQSIQQASEWMAKVWEERENYFDQLLVKIDHVMKDVVHVDEINDWTLFLEIEGDVVFIEKELHHINQDLMKIHILHESDKQFILARLEGILDHIEQLNQNLLPDSLQNRLQALKEGVFYSLSRFTESY